MQMIQPAYPIIQISQTPANFCHVGPLHSDGHLVLKASFFVVSIPSFIGTLITRYLDLGLENNMSKFMTFSCYKMFLKANPKDEGTSMYQFSVISQTG